MTIIILRIDISSNNGNDAPRKEMTIANEDYVPRIFNFYNTLSETIMEVKARLL